jgi:hypothetical protein
MDPTAIGLDFFRSKGQYVHMTGRWELYVQSALFLDNCRISNATTLHTVRGGIDSTGHHVSLVYLSQDGYCIGLPV